MLLAVGMSHEVENLIQENNELLATKFVNTYLFSLKLLITILGYKLY